MSGFEIAGLLIPICGQIAASVDRISSIVDRKENVPRLFHRLRESAKKLCRDLELLNTEQQAYDYVVLSGSDHRAINDTLEECKTALDECEDKLKSNGGRLLAILTIGLEKKLEDCQKQIDSDTLRYIQIAEGRLTRFLVT